MAIPFHRLSPSRPSRGFTLVEGIIYAGLLMSFSVVGFRSMFAFIEGEKLRMAAIELTSYLEVARSVALTDESPCVIALGSSSGGIFSPDTSVSTNSCRAGKIDTTLNLKQLTGSSNLSVSILPGAGSYPLIFNPEGTTRNGVTVLISSNNVPSGSWCVDVQAPLATVRRGWLARDSNLCSYTLEQ